MEQIRIWEGGLNTDDSPETMPASDYPFLLNGIRAKSYAGKGGAIENQLGTTAIAGITELDANSTCIGAIRDQKNSAWYCFFVNTNLTKNCIVKLNLLGISPSITKVMSFNVPAWVTLTTYLIGDQVSSGGTNWRSLTIHNDAVAPVEGAIWTAIPWAGLGFTSNNLITGGAVVGNVLYWTDNTTGPHAANITKYAGGKIPLDDDEISLLKRGGLYSPTFVKSSLGAYNNSTSRFGFQFAYQYVYDDNQFSVLSPYSALCPTNTPQQTYNSVTITSPDLVPPIVKTIKWAARISNTGAFFYIGDSQRPDVGWGSGDHSIIFYNNANGAAVADNYSFQFHDVPRQVKCMEVAKNRLWLGNYLEGYDTPPAVGDMFLINAVQTIPVGLTQAIPSTDVFKVRGITWTWGGSSYTPSAAFFLQDTAPAADLMLINPVRVFNKSTLLSRLSGQRVILSGTYINNASTVLPADLNFTTRAPFGTPFHGAYTTYELFKVATATYTTSIVDGTQYEGQRTFPAGSSYSIGKIFKDGQGRSSGVVDPQGFNTHYNNYFNGETLYWKLPTIYDPTLTYTLADGGMVFYLGILYRVVVGMTVPLATPPPNATYWVPIDNPIPTWATSYSIVMTKNLTKSYFLEDRSADMNYAKTDSAGTTLSSTYSPANDEITVDVRPLMKSGLGYDWQLGDRCVLYPTVVNAVANGIVGAANPWITGTHYYIGTIISNGGFRWQSLTDHTDAVAPVSGPIWLQLPAISVDLPINSFDGTRLHLPNVSIGVLSSPCKTDFEIYRPALATEATLYYEIGQTYPIITDSFAPAYSIGSAQIVGDAVQTVRSMYILSAGPTYVIDTFQPFSLVRATSLDPIGNWDTDIGKPYVVTTIGQVTKSNFFKFSSTAINGTSVNGLSEFYFLDEDSVAQEDGEMNKLISTAREKDESTVLLAICRNGASSIYIDQAKLNLDQTTSFLIQAANVIGGEKHLIGGYGTVNPESVFQINDNTYWYDNTNGRYIRYATNGLFAISDFKMIHNFEDMRAAINAGGTSRVITGYDPFYRLILTTSSLMVASRKTVSWNESSKRWISFHSVVPDWYFDIGGIGFSVKAGTFYSHNNATAFNTFYGVVANTVLELNFNDTGFAPAYAGQPNHGGVIPKYWTSVAILVSPPTGAPTKDFWSWVAGEQVVPTNILKFELENIYGQGTDIEGARWDIDENIAYGVIFKDKNTSGVANPYVNGDDMYSHIALGRVTIFGKASDVFKQINFVKLGYELSKGHTL